jgi:phage/plasmid-associated DNA primase
LFKERLIQAIDDLQNEANPDQNLIDAVEFIINKQLTNSTFKDGMIKELQSLYESDDVDEWLNSRDRFDHILGFDDAVYDFSIPGFRQGEPNDMVTMTVGFKRKQVEECDKTVQAKIVAALEGMHDPEVFKYLMKTLATSVDGDRPNDIFMIWTGTGANGKGLTKTICSKAFGDYFYDPGQTVFANRAVSGSCLSSELTKLKGKRICMTSECEAVNDKLRVGVLKHCTGHDKIQARGLYQEASEFKVQANIVMMFNEVLGCDDNTDGVERRLRLINFLMKYVLEVEPNREMVIIAFLIRVFNRYFPPMNTVRHSSTTS